MRNIKESVEIDASRQELWGLLVDPATIAAHCPGVTSYELQPSDEPIGVGSEMHVGVAGGSGLVVAKVVVFDEPGYAVRSQIMSGPYGLQGQLGASLKPITEARSALLVDGGLDCGWLGKPGLLAFLFGFHVGLPLLSQNIANLARAESSAE